MSGHHVGAGDTLAAAEGLMGLSRLVQGVFTDTSEHHDLTPVQARLLCVLAFGPRGMGELARIFGVEKAALTGLVDRAEGRGLVRRSAVPGDRRALRVSLTDTGRGAAAAFHAEVAEQLNGLLGPLSPAVREHFLDSMATVITGAARSTTKEPA